MHHLKSLIFDCLSFTEGLITSLSSTDREAPDFNRRSSFFANDFQGVASPSGTFYFYITVYNFIRKKIACGGHVW